MKMLWIIEGYLVGKGGVKHKYAFSGLKGTFALVCISPNGTVKGAHAWNSQAEAQAALDIYKSNPKAWEMLAKLNPSVQPMHTAEDLLSKADKRKMQ